LANLDLKRFKDLLLEERRRVVAELSDLEESYLKKNRRDSAGDVSGYSTHPADQGSDEAMRDTAFLMGEAGGEVLEEIDEALDRLKSDKYGCCETCGADIPEARLEAIPYAKFCLKCKNELERSGGVRPR
jgi:DnaK suppressor protein